MMGLPTETYEDLDGISDICKKVAYCWRENTPNRARGVRITASASCFVPKPQTPFQWDAQDTLEQFREKQAHLKVVMKPRMSPTTGMMPRPRCSRALLHAATAVRARRFCWRGSAAARWTAGISAST